MYSTYIKNTEIWDTDDEEIIFTFSLFQFLFDLFLDVTSSSCNSMIIIEEATFQINSPELAMFLNLLGFEPRHRGLA